MGELGPAEPVPRDGSWKMIEQHPCDIESHATMPSALYLTLGDASDQYDSDFMTTIMSVKRTKL